MEHTTNSICEKNVYLYTETNMPKNGWFQGCYSCGCITKYTVLMYSFDTSSNIIYVFNVFTCPTCKRNHRKNVNVYDIYKQYCMKQIHSIIQKNKLLFV